MKKHIVVITTLVCVAVLLSACCNPLAIPKSRTEALMSEDVQGAAVQEVATPCPTCEPTLGREISLGPNSVKGLAGRADRAGFLAELAGALVERGWSIITQHAEYLTVEEPDTSLKVNLVYSHDSSTLNRIIVEIIFGGIGPDTNLSCEALEAYNQVNDEYNLGKISADADGDIWFETVYAFTDALEPDAFADYLVWIGDRLFLMLEDIEDYTS